MRKRGKHVFFRSRIFSFFLYFVALHVKFTPVEEFSIFYVVFQGNSEIMATQDFGSSLPPDNSLIKKGLRKDPRPLADEAYQKQCINKLFRFLKMRQFPYVISRENLFLPTKTEFEMIFQFLYQLWDPEYKVEKIEDEVPKIMKNFNYPFPITSSELTQITFLSWPNLLGAIMWLVDLNQCFFSIGMDEYASATDSEITDEQSILINYICQGISTAVPSENEKQFSTLVYGKHSMGFNVEELLEENEELEELVVKETEEQFRQRLADMKPLCLERPKKCIGEERKTQKDMSYRENYHCAINHPMLQYNGQAELLKLIRFMCDYKMKAKAKDNFRKKVEQESQNLDNDIFTIQSNLQKPKDLIEEVTDELDENIAAKKEKLNCPVEAESSSTDDENAISASSRNLELLKNEMYSEMEIILDYIKFMEKDAILI